MFRGEYSTENEKETKESKDLGQCVENENQRKGKGEEVDEKKDNVSNEEKEEREKGKQDCEEKEKGKEETMKENEKGKEETIKEIENDKTNEAKETMKESDETKDKERENDDSVCEAYTDGEELTEDLQINAKLLEALSKFSHRFPGQIIYRGMMFNELVQPEDIEGVRTLQFENNTILLAGFPRSGTTWLGEILYLLSSSLDFTTLEEKMCYYRVLWLDDVRCHHLITKRSPCLMKSHLPPSLLPPSAFKPLKTKIVLAIRNPKDVAVAYFYFYRMSKRVGNFAGSFEEFAEMFMDGFVHFGDWTRHVNMWWEKSKMCDNILPVFYEETKQDPLAAVWNLAQFLGKDVTEQEVKKIVEETSFAKMKARPTSNLENVKSYSGDFIRKGEVGDWKNHFSEELQEKFDAWINREIKDEELRKRLNIQ